MILGLVFIVVAVAFKLGAVPFHMWLPDVYHGAPTSVTLFIGTAPKLAYFALAFRLLAQGLGGAIAEWTQMLGALAVLTLVVGNVVAHRADESQAHAGVLDHRERRLHRARLRRRHAGGYSAALYYTLVYVLVALGSFGVILLASRKGFEADELERLQGPVQARSAARARDDGADVLHRRRAAVRGLLGEAAHHPGAVGRRAHLWLVIIAAAMSVIGAFYYLRVVKLMYFDAPGRSAGRQRQRRRAPGARASTRPRCWCWACCPQPLLNLCARLIH